MSLEHVAPARVAELAGAPGRVHDVGEHHGGQHAVGLAPRARAGDELLGLVERGFGVAGDDQVLVAGQPHELRAGDPAREVLGVAPVDERVLAPVHDERGDPDRRQHVAHVHVGHPVDQGSHSARAGR